MAERRLPRGLLDPESQAIAEAYEAIPSVRRQTRGLLSLDPQEEQGMGQAAIEMLASFIPGVGQLLAGRDIERARRAGDPAAAAMAATEFLPFGRLAGMMRRPGPIMSELDVYHGSPHRFEEFDASKIGTGEGAQSYGHGIYLAESPRVAKDYQAATSKDRFLTDNGFFDPSELEHLNVRVKARSGDLDSAIEAAKKFGAPDEDYPETAAKAARDLAKLEALKARGGMRPNPGNFYTADLPDEMVDRMLDWDKPLSEQPHVMDWLAKQEAIKTKRVLEARKQTLKNVGENALNAEILKKQIALLEEEVANPSAAGLGMLSGGEYHNYLRMRDVNPVEQAKMLREAGIPGIRYLDAGSRGQGGSGTRNFVVFPGEEKKVKILKRE